MKIGCHVSIAGGVNNAPARAKDLGCEVFQCFTRSPQGGKAPELTPELLAPFKQELDTNDQKAVYIHAPYYINFASGNNRIRHGSVSVIRDELERGTLLGAKYVMFHTGSGKDLGRDTGLQKAIEMLKRSLDGYEGSCELLIENAAGAGEIIGDTFAEVAELLNGVNHPKLTGICLDTQHAFASGYDWRTKESAKEAINRIDTELGDSTLIKMMHLNDSKVDFNTKRDRHDHIGRGYIGLDGIKNIVTFAKQLDIDCIIETPHPEVQQDIKTVKELRDS